MVSAAGRAEAETRENCHRGDKGTARKWGVRTCSRSWPPDAFKLSCSAVLQASSLQPPAALSCQLSCHSPLLSTVVGIQSITCCSRPVSAAVLLICPYAPAIICSALSSRYTSLPWLIRMRWLKPRKMSKNDSQPSAEPSSNPCTLHPIPYKPSATHNPTPHCLL